MNARRGGQTACSTCDLPSDARVAGFAVLEAWRFVSGEVSEPDSWYVMESRKAACLRRGGIKCLERVALASHACDIEGILPSGWELMPPTTLGRRLLQAAIAHSAEVATLMSSWQARFGDITAHAAQHTSVHTGQVASTQGQDVLLDTWSLLNLGVIACVRAPCVLRE